VSNNGHTIDVPAPYFGPNKPWEPGDPIPPVRDPNLSKIVKIIGYVTAGALAAAGISGMTQQADETAFVGLPLDPSFNTTFSDGSSGYFTSQQISAMQQYLIPIVSVNTNPSYSVTFSDGSSGYFTSQQICAMQQLGIQTR